MFIMYIWSHILYCMLRHYAVIYEAKISIYKHLFIADVKIIISKINFEKNIFIYYLQQFNSALQFSDVTTSFINQNINIITYYTKY